MSAAHSGQIQIETAGEFLHPLLHGACGTFVGGLKCCEGGGFRGFLPIIQQAGIELHPQGLLIAREPDACPSVFTAALDLHGIKFLLQFLSILLDLLCLAKGFGELSEIGKSETGHGVAEGTARLGRHFESQPFHLRLKLDAMGIGDLLLHYADQVADVRGACFSSVDNEIGMHLRDLRATDTAAFQP